MPAVSMGEPINSPTEECWPYVTPDGAFFFFVTVRQGDRGDIPYWMDASIIDRVRESP